jgi:DNA-binding response OmpR family regulator
MQIRVLLVDDEVELVETLVERLRFRGLDAQGATTGEQAIEYLMNHRFDVVVADLKMPSLDGNSIQRLVKERYPQTRVILMTGHGAEEGEVPADADCLLKPFSIETLLDRIMSEDPESEQTDAG